MVTAMNSTRPMVALLAYAEETIVAQLLIIQSRPRIAMEVLNAMLTMTAKVSMTLAKMADAKTVHVLPWIPAQKSAKTISTVLIATIRSSASSAYVAPVNVSSEMIRPQTVSRSVTTTKRAKLNSTLPMGVSSVSAAAVNVSKSKTPIRRWTVLPTAVVNRTGNA